MPGVSSRQPVPGAYGVGKVKLKFTERKKRGFPYGLLFYLVCVFTFVSAFLWTKKWSRINIILPILRAFIFVADLLWNFGRPTLDILQRNNHILFNLDGSANVTGNSTTNVLFSQGYLHASERLFQMDVLGRRTAIGTLSEVIGRDGLQSDKMARTFNLPALAEEDYAAMPESEKRMLGAYCDGVNAFLRELRALPSEFAVLTSYDEYSNFNKSMMMPLWTPVHTLAMMRYYDIERSHGWEQELVEQYVERKLGQEAAAQLFGPGPPNMYCDMDNVHCLPSLNGNNWAISPVDAKIPSIFASNSHDKPSYPSRWIINRLTSPHLSAYGTSLPGIPFVYEGKNDVYSWGANVAANIDTEDVYVEDLVEQTSTDGTTLAYTIRSSSADITVQSFIVRSSIIRVKVPHSNSTMEETDRYEHIPFDAEDSVHGPVVTVNAEDHDDAVDAFLGSRRGYAQPVNGTLLHVLSSTLTRASGSTSTPVKLSLCSQALRQRVDLKYLFGVNTAKSFEEFKAAVGELKTTALNVIYTGQDGVGYAISGRVPVRTSEHQVEARRPTSGSVGREWQVQNTEEKYKPPHMFISRSEARSDVVIAAVEAASVGSRVLDLLFTQLNQSYSQSCPVDSVASNGVCTDDNSSTITQSSLEATNHKVLNDDYSPSGIRIKNLLLAHVDPALSNGGAEICSHYICAGCDKMIKSFLEEFSGRYVYMSRYSPVAPLLVELFRQQLWAFVSAGSLKGPAQSILYGNNDFSNRFKASNIPRYGSDWLLDLLEDTSDNSSIWVDNTIVKAHIAREYRNAALNFSSVDKKHHLICRTLGSVLNEEVMLNLYTEGTKPKSMIYRSVKSSNGWDSLHQVRKEHYFDSLYGRTGMASEVYSRGYTPVLGTVDTIYRSAYTPSAYRVSTRVPHVLEVNGTFSAFLRPKKSEEKLERASFDRISQFPTMGMDPFTAKRVLTAVPMLDLDADDDVPSVETAIYL